MIVQYPKIATKILSDTNYKIYPLYCQDIIVLSFKYYLHFIDGEYQMNELIVKKVKAARLERGLTQKDLAKLLDRTSASISDLERAKVQVTASDLAKLAKYLNKPIEYFYGDSFGGDEVDNLVALIRKMDPEIRSEQINVINSLLVMQVSFANLDTDSENDIDDDALKEMAKETYDHLIVYLTGVRQLYDKGIDAKNKMEEILGINISDLSEYG